MSGDETPDTDQEQIEQAFVGSENHSLNGTKLFPYTPDRMIAAQSMGLMFGYLNADESAIFEDRKIYPGALRDVIIVMWLCSLSSEDEIDSAARDPRGAYKKAKIWAISKGIADDASPEFIQAYSAFAEIQREISASRVSAEKKTAIQTTPLTAAA